jgi:hypothetical protein
MREFFNAGDTAFYKRRTDHYLQCRVVQVAGGETGIHIALLEADWYPSSFWVQPDALSREPLRKQKPTKSHLWRA